MFSVKIAIDTCVNLEGLNVHQATRLRKAIDEDKWYLSEKEHHDVGQKFAEDHFIKNRFSAWAQAIREEYCRGLCPYRENCSARKRFLKVT